MSCSGNYGKHPFQQEAFMGRKLSPFKKEASIQ
jgi:hypothetical protein